MKDAELEAAVAAYRAELTAEAELARGDLDEIEDHLRALVEELRAAGAGAGAIAEARRRLGEPRALAREHARVRTPFGARPSRLAAWGAAALLAPIVALATWRDVGQLGVWSRAGLEAGLSAIVLGALVMRRAWARAIVVGHAGVALAMIAAWSWMQPGRGVVIAEIAALGGALALLAPRRRAIAPAGLALGVLPVAYVAAQLACNVQMTLAGGAITAAAMGPMALLLVLAAGAGIVLRARWGAYAAGGAAAALMLMMARTWDLTWRFAHADATRALVLATFGAGAAAAMLAAIATWRGGRPGLGTLRGVLE